jgi:hypothetical protein
MRCCGHITVKEEIISENVLNVKVNVFKKGKSPRDQDGNSMLQKMSHGGKEKNHGKKLSSSCGKSEIDEEPWCHVTHLKVETC